MVPTLVTTATRMTTTGMGSEMREATSVITPPGNISKILNFNDDCLVLQRTDAELPARQHQIRIRE